MFMIDSVLWFGHTYGGIISCVVLVTTCGNTRANNVGLIYRLYQVAHFLKLVHVITKAVLIMLLEPECGWLLWEMKSKPRRIVVSSTFSFGAWCFLMFLVKHEMGWTQTKAKKKTLRAGDCDDQVWRFAFIMLESTVHSIHINFTLRKPLSVAQS